MLERFDVNDKKNIFTSNLAKHNLSEKGLFTLCNCYV